MTLSERCRHVARGLRVKPTPLSEFIALLQQCADALDAYERMTSVSVLARNTAPLTVDRTDQQAVLRAASEEKPAP